MSRVKSNVGGLKMSVKVCKTTKGEDHVVTILKRVSLVLFALYSVINVHKNKPMFQIIT